MTRLRKAVEQHDERPVDWPGNVGGEPTLGRGDIQRRAPFPNRAYRLLTRSGIASRTWGDGTSLTYGKHTLNASPMLLPRRKEIGASAGRNSTTTPTAWRPR